MQVRRRPRPRQAGLTLAEMVVTVAVLAVAAAIAIPTADPVAPASVDAAASEVAQAIRFAQREAIRTGAWHVARIDPATQTVRVYRLTTSGVVKEDTGKPVLHPVEHREYRIVVGNGTPARARITGSQFDYKDGGRTNYVSFGPDGNPADIHGWLLKDIDPLKYIDPKVTDPNKDSNLVTVAYGRLVRQVRVSAVTGRVTF
jgi:prepilin-type N-terminal cleavage/methylation domain-containing protein